MVSVSYTHLLPGHFEDLREILRVRLAVVHVLIRGDELEIRRGKADPAQARLHAVPREKWVRREEHVLAVLCQAVNERAGERVFGLSLIRI